MESFKMRKLLFLFPILLTAQQIDFTSQIKNFIYIYDTAKKYTTLSSICTDAVNLGAIAYITKTWDLNATCAANLYLSQSGIIKPASGHTIVLTGYIDGSPNNLHFDTSLGGTITVTGAKFS